MKRLEPLLIPRSPEGLSEEAGPAVEEGSAQKERDSADASAADPIEVHDPQSRIADPEEFFAWLGILAENASFTAKTAATLWQQPVEDTDAILQHWVKQRGVIARADQPRTYQLPVALHQEAYQCLLYREQLSPQQAHTLLIDRYRARTYQQLWHTLEDDGYIYAHLTWHLQGANQCDEIHLLLQEDAESGANGWYETCDRTGSLHCFDRDLALAWQLAEDMYAQAPVQAIQLQCRYALMTVVSYAGSRLPANLVAAFVHQQVWTAAQSLAYLERVLDPQHRFAVLQNLIPALPSTEHPELLNVIQQQPHCNHQAQLLRILVPLLDPVLYPELLRRVEILDTDGDKAMVLRELAAVLPTSDLDQILAITQTLNLTESMVAACGIVRRWPQTQAMYLQMLAQAAQSNVEEEAVYADLLRAIIPNISGAHLPKLLALIHVLPDAAARVDLLIQLLPQHPQLLTVAFQTACTIPSEMACAIALGKLAPRLTEIDIHLALTILDTFKNPVAVRCALLPISAYHPSASISGKLIEIIEAFPSESAQCQALCGLFSHLPLTMQGDIKARIEAVSDPTTRATALSRLAVQDKSLMPSALLAITQCQDVEVEFEAYWILAQRWPKLIPAALKSACQIKRMDPQVWAIHQLAPHLKEQQLKEVCAIAKQIRDQEHRQRILDEIIPYSSKNILIHIRELWHQFQDNKVYATVLGTLKAQRTALNIKLSPGDARQQAIHALTAFLPDPVLQQTLATTFDFEDPINCAKSLNRLLSQLHPSQVDYPLWCKILHALTHLEHDRFFLSLPRLIPFLVQMAGPEIHAAMIQNIQIIQRQW